MMQKIPLGLTFDDVLLIPQKSDILPSEVDLITRLTRRIKVRVPLLSAAMDTVSETAMAIALARQGGIGVLHRNCTIEQEFNMVKEVKGREKNLMVGAAVGPHDIERAKALDLASADVIVIDCAHAHKSQVISDAKKIKRAIKAQLIVGNIATAKAARAFLPIADALKVGIGPGSICTTRVVAGVGVPQLRAIMDVAKIAKKAGVPVIADGGIRYSGDIVKALAAGADTVMIGSLFAGTDETPGALITLEGKKYKAYRGMGSLGAMNAGQSADRYGQKGSRKYVPEGVEALVAFKGPLNEVIFQLLGGVKAGMGYVGAKTIGQLQRKAKFMQITDAGRKESHPHSVLISRKAPNYEQI